MKEKIEKFSLKQQILKYPLPNIVRYFASGTSRSKQTSTHLVCLERTTLTAALLPLFLSWLMIFIRNAGFGLHISGYWDWNSIQTHKLPLYIIWIRIKSSYWGPFEHYRDFCWCDEGGGWSMARVLMDACYYWPCQYCQYTSCPQSSLITPWNAGQTIAETQINKCAITIHIRYFFLVLFR